MRSEGELRRHLAQLMGPAAVDIDVAALAEERVPVAAVVSRMLRNVVGIFRQQQESALPHDDGERRLLSACNQLMCVSPGDGQARFMRAQLLLHLPGCCDPLKALNDLTVLSRAQPGLAHTVDRVIAHAGSVLHRLKLEDAEMANAAASEEGEGPHRKWFHPPVQKTAAGSSVAEAAATEAATGTDCESRRPACVAYRVGQLVRHKNYGYRGVICGWDETCCASEAWATQMGVKLLPGGTAQPFYNVLVDNRDRPSQTTYMAEENIILLEDTGDGVQHSDVGLHFDYFVEWANVYLPSAELQRKYPHDALQLNWPAS
jgi:hemimethylated DNA binding protein